MTDHFGRTDLRAHNTDPLLAITAEYKCHFGISSATPGLDEPGTFDTTMDKHLSTMTILGKDNRVYWFMYEKLGRRYESHEIPRYSPADAEAFALKHARFPIMPNSTVTFGDIWQHRITNTLLALEEAVFDTWTWGRIACVGDCMHKMTPNAGFGGNAGMESAASLTNALHSMLQKNSNRPSQADITQALHKYQSDRRSRAAGVVTMANLITRIHALKNPFFKFAAHHVLPRLGDVLVDLQGDSYIGAERLDFLPPPERSVKGNMLFNPTQGASRKESLIKRFFFALPFVGLAMFAATSTPGLSTVISRDLVSSARSPYEAAFFADYGLIYAILLIESSRRSNALTLAQMYVLTPP